jgi:hypothetical protein
MNENRETLEAPPAKPGNRTVGEGESRTAHMYVPEESHGGIVPMNYSNKDKMPSAESGEGRPPIKENPVNLTRQACEKQQGKIRR